MRSLAFEEVGGSGPSAVQFQALGCGPATRHRRFTCRGAGHTSAAGMVMAFNPDDPHDGESAVELGFTYRIMHIGPDVVRAVLDDVTDGRGAMPLFERPVLRLRRARTLLIGGRPMAEAATEAGFADQAHFHRWFVRCFGVTPVAFRRAAART